MSEIKRYSDEELDVYEPTNLLWKHNGYWVRQFEHQRDTAKLQAKIAKLEASNDLMLKDLEMLQAEKVELERKFDFGSHVLFKDDLTEEIGEGLLIGCRYGFGEISFEVQPLGYKAGRGPIYVTEFQAKAAAKAKRGI